MRFDGSISGLDPALDGSPSTRLNITTCDRLARVSGIDLSSMDGSKHMGDDSGPRTYNRRTSAHKQVPHSQVHVLV